MSRFELRAKQRLVHSVILTHGSVRPFSMNRTVEGKEKPSPSTVRISFDLPSTYDTVEFVVPRSMPMQLTDMGEENNGLR